MKKALINFLVIFLAISGFVLFLYFYFDHKKSQENANKVQQVILEANMPREFYQKDSNKFCIRVDDKFEQKSIIDDIAWMVELSGLKVRQIKIIDCDNNHKGVLIK